MTSNYGSQIKCPRCGHDQNSANAIKCEICGALLRKNAVSSVVRTGLALVITGACIGGLYLVATHFIGTNVSNTTNNTILPPSSNVVPSIDISLPNPSVLTMDGSTTMVALVQRLRNAYAQINPNIPTTYGEPNGFPRGSSKGIAALINNSVIMAASSRPLKPQEAQAGISVVAIARDAVAVMVSKNNPFTSGLTQDQLRQIYQGKITNWSQVGGPNVPIKVINRAVSSGTRDFFKSSVLLDQEFAPDSPNFVTVPEDETTGIIRMLGNDGISYATVTQLENQQTVRIVPIDGISPTDKTTIQNGKYPLSRNLYLVIRKQNSPAVKQFIDLALSEQGQQIAQQSGFISLK